MNYSCLKYVICSRPVQVNAILADAARAAEEKAKQAPPSHPERSPVAPSPRTSFGRPPSTRGGIRPGPERRTSMLEPSSPAIEAGTWRSKAAPVPPPQRMPERAPPSAVPLMPHVDFSITMDDDVEVMDFTEHGKLAGRETVEDEQVPSNDRPHPPPPPIRTPRTPRPAAADFFQDSEEPPKSEESSWRRRTSFTQEPASAVVPWAPDEAEGRSKVHIPLSPNHSHPDPHGRHFSHNDEHDRSYSEHPSYGGNQPLKSPLSSVFREAPMSALDDTMARIKGALDGMHKVEPRQRFLPPALRPRPEHGEHPEHFYHDHDEHVHREPFALTSIEPPRSPKPAWKHFVVQLPPISLPKGDVPFKRLRGFTAQANPRLDVFSLTAPRHGKNRQDVLVESLLFVRPQGQPYAVSLPSKTRVTNAPTFENGNPKVNLPLKIRPVKTPDSGAFGRPREADGASSWRKPVSSPLKQSQVAELPRVLDTISRSPPPESPIVANGMPAPSAPSPTVSVPPVKMKGPTKAVQDVAVGFYRPGSTDVSKNGTMKFIVSSELEDDSKNHSPSEKRVTFGEISPSVKVTRPSAETPSNNGDASKVGTLFRVPHIF